MTDRFGPFSTPFANSWNHLPRNPGASDSKPEKSLSALVSLIYLVSLVYLVPLCEKPDRPDQLTRSAFPASPARLAMFLYPLFAFPAKQQCLYFLPLPQGQGALRLIPWRLRGIKGSSDSVSW